MGPADLTGAVLDGRYRIIELVAQGAMGVVYRAERVKLGRIVAVKILHELLPSELASRKRFEIEAMAMAKLEHPHCASVVDVGLHEERPFVVMDFVSGRNLRDVIAAEAPLPIVRAVEILRQVLSGLAHAHELGIVHRDIKPANVVLSQKAGLGDHVKILDFGLARLSQDSSLTTGIVVGTPSYMAPEQIRGLPVDGRVDVYACGVVLFELLTGGKPFVSAADDPIEVCTLHLKQPPPRLADLRPGVDFGELEGVVARALAKSPDDRFESAVALSAALDAAVPRRAASTPVAGVAVVPAAPVDPRAGRTLPMPVLAGEPAAGPGLAGEPAGEPAAGPVLACEPAAGPGRSSSSSLAGAGVDGAPAFGARPLLGEPAGTASGGGAALAALAGTRAASAGSGGTVVEGAPGLGAVVEGAPGLGAVVDGAPGLGPSSFAGGGAGPALAARAGSHPRPLDVRRVATIAGGGLLALVVIIAVAAGGGGGGAPATAPPADAAAALDAEVAGDPADEVVARANQLVADGQKGAAIELVAAARKLHPGDARLPYLLGKLYFERYYWTDGMRMLREAIRLAPGYRTDPELIRTVLRGFITTPRAEPAIAAFLREDIGDAARPFLEATAAEHPSSMIRQRAAAELRRYR